MSKLWEKLGTLAFWLAWPGLWLFLNGTKRARLLLVHDGKVLVVKSWLGSGRWGLPGGGQHRNETSAQALIREVHEEVGVFLSPNEIKPLFNETIRDKGMSADLDFFVAEVSAKPEIKPRPLEVSHFAWLKPSELNPKNAGLDVLHGLANYFKQA